MKENPSFHIPPTCKTANQIIVINDKSNKIKSISFYNWKHLEDELQKNRRKYDAEGIEMLV